MASPGADPDLVSCILPAYNAEAFIGEALASALAQTYRRLEVIVVDDGSTDGTAEIAARAAAADPRVRLLRQRNAGVAAARNLAVDAACGALIAPLDADDLWHPQKLARQVAVMRRAGPRAGVVYCWTALIDEAGALLALPEPPTCEGDVLVHLVHSHVVGCASVPLIRRSSLLRAGGYDSGLRARGAQGCEDLKLSLRLAEHCHFRLVPARLVGYRITARSMSHDVPQMRRSFALVLDETRRRHPELPRRLFRWAHANAHWWLAAASLRGGRRGLAAALLARALLLDPGLALQLPAALRRQLGIGRGTAARPAGFAALAADPPSLDPPTCARPRRQAALKALCARRAAREAPQAAADADAQ